MLLPFFQKQLKRGFVLLLQLSIQGAERKKKPKLVVRISGHRLGVASMCRLPGRLR
jgi:hypothetical protein